MKYRIIAAVALSLFQLGCACTRSVEHLGQTRVNVSQPRIVNVMSDGSLVAEASLVHVRMGNQKVVKEQPRYFTIPSPRVSNALQHAGSRGRVSIALTRENTIPELTTFPEGSAITGTYTNHHRPTSALGVKVPYKANGAEYQVEICRSYVYEPTYKPIGYQCLSGVLYVPAFVVDIVTFPIQAATWEYGPGP